jgi:hypothetical protein
VIQKSIIFARQNLYDMTVISSAELRNNTNKYLDLAATETVIIQSEKTDVFVLSKLERIPDADLSRTITADELLTGIKSDIRAMYANNKQCPSPQGRGL